MVPFYIYYSMFGFQRVGDFIWAAGDMQARGFLLGGTAGRTTLAGEGLQHQDGHSQLRRDHVPNCVAYDPAYAYELAVIIQDGLRRMYAEQENIFYYLTVHERELRAAGDAGGRGAGDPQGHVPAAAIGGRGKVRVNLLGSGTILREVLAAAEILEKDLRRAGRRLQRHELHASCAARRSTSSAGTCCIRASRRARRTCSSCSPAHAGPFVAATDYMRMVPDQIRAVGAGPLSRARHRRLRPQRLARRAAQLLRGRSPLHRRSPRSRRWPTRAGSTWRR